MSDVRRIYIEKKDDYQIRAKELLHQITSYLDIRSIEGVRILNCYDIENIAEDVYKNSLGTVFAELPLDIVHEEILDLKEDEVAFGVEYLPGQFDQRADSAVQCIKLINENSEPVVRSAFIYVLKGNLLDIEIDKIKKYCINPVDSREASLEKPESLIQEFEEPSKVIILDSFIEMEEDELKVLYNSLNLAMTFLDFKHINKYFKEEEKRNPSITEIRVLDTYWSDHCRHTTFLTELKNIKFADGDYSQVIEHTYNEYTKSREVIYKDRDDKHVCLMDIALMAMRELRNEGKLDDLEVSEEINACSIIVPVDIDGKEEEWLVMFKNETHNHPTEIEPFGGAATCLGGAIRDPLSGRSFVYQAMRVTGCADPTVDLSETMSGKLPQRKITTEAANGYSSYGNQIGLATGLVDEVYHDNYKAKRLEIGAVIAAAQRENVIRETSDPGDVIILLGGRTGRDGCGGATGSSKSHTEESILTCGAEVQKGNPPTERKIQRLFRNKEVSTLIKKCNDFGAGGVAVAIGELADGLVINLDKVPKKYEGLDGTELAISESQERMAVVVDKKDVEKFINYVAKENLESTVVAEVTEEKRLIMKWKGDVIVNISRKFLDTNGAHQVMDVEVISPSKEDNYFVNSEINDVKEKWFSTLSDLNVCSKRGLMEQFDSSIGASTVLMPFGGKNQLTPIQTMVAKIPVEKGITNKATMMSYGYDPYLSSWSPYHGSVYAVLHSISKIVATGGDYKGIRFTFQEYFKRLGNDKKRWGEPLSALLGAYLVQKEFGLPSIGGKDSMSGTFNDLDVPPTLVSFAVNTINCNNVVSPELKEVGSKLIKIAAVRDENELPNFDILKEQYERYNQLVNDGKVLSAYAVGFGGLCEAISKMAFGNGIGVNIEENVLEEQLFEAEYGAIVLEVRDLADLNGIDYEVVGTTCEETIISYKEVVINMNDCSEKWESTLEDVFPTKTDGKVDDIAYNKVYESNEIYICKNKVAKPKVFIPVFPGTNCEYDTMRAFEEAGAEVETAVFNNLNPESIRESIEYYAKEIKQSQILMIAGGFSAGDEPDGSGKFIANVFRNDIIKEAVLDMLNNRDGLALGICNGFQALVKLGLVPFGDIRAQKDGDPTLTTNKIGKHMSKMVSTKITSNKSPWLAECQVGDVHSIAISHGEGRFVANEEWLKKLFDKGQVATQYVDSNGNPTLIDEYNPNGSYCAIEGITSLDGRVLGKMGHSERIGSGVAKNISGNKDQKIFESGVKYFR